MIEPNAEQRQHANALYAQFFAYRQAGFSDDHAMEILLTFVTEGIEQNKNDE